MPEEQKHSPLPWKTDGSFVRDINAGNIYVANCMSWSDLSAKANAQGKTKLPDIDEAKANAQFIVRAANNFEELLEACKSWETLWELRPLDSGADMQDILRKCWNKTEKAITKAEKGS